MTTKSLLSIRFSNWLSLKTASGHQFLRKGDAMHAHNANAVDASFYKVRTWVAASLVLAVGILFGSVASAQEVLPVPPPPFKGQIGLSAKDSTPDFPEPIQAPKGAPNIVLVLLDDVGFGASSTFWRTRRDTDTGKAREERTALHAVSHHSVVFAHTRGAADRPQSPLRAHRGNHGTSYRFPRL